ncbi:hypothetical protein [Actinopolymorpha alba]|uniref:hypothetical protein n=1 Tax=Actinopolymorpha alba TaxID=533267 RepID=UPI00035E1FE8|nr:hypothetical protein [Actinopolymorpha alba]
MTDIDAPGGAGPRAAKLRVAVQERERADAAVRMAIARLLAQPGSVTLQTEVAVALIREQASGIRYAAALKAVGWLVPEGLLDDVPHDQHP